MEELAAAYTGPHQITLNRNSTNLGVGAHVQQIFSQASGEIVVMATGDDITIPKRVSTVADRLLSDSSVLAFISAFEYIDNSGKKVKGLWAPSSADQTIENYSEGVIMCPGASCAWSKTLCTGWPQVERLIHEDRVFPMRAVLMGGKVFCSGELLVMYRSLGGVSRTTKIKIKYHPLISTINLLNRIRPDGLQRVLDFNNHRNIYFEHSGIRVMLENVLFNTDQELAALKRGGVRIDLYYLTSFVSKRLRLDILRSYLRLRAKIARGHFLRACFTEVQD